MVRITIFFIILSLINLNKMSISYEYCFYANFSISLLMISTQQIEKAFFKRRLFLHNYFNQKSWIYRLLKGGFILSSVQIVKSILMSFMLAFSLTKFNELMWLFTIISALAFSLFKQMIATKMKPHVYDELCDYFAQNLTRWCLFIFHGALFFMLQLYEPVDNLTGLSLIEALESLHKENQFHMMPFVGGFLNYLELFHDTALWALQNINLSTDRLADKIIKWILITWFCFSSILYSWFLLYFYAGLCSLIDWKLLVKRLNQLTQRYQGGYQK